MVLCVMVLLTSIRGLAQYSTYSDTMVILPLPPPKYALWEGVDNAIHAIQKRGVSVTFDHVMEELYTMHKNNEVQLPFDPYWRGKMKRPLTNKKREKAEFETQLRKRLAVVCGKASGTSLGNNSIPRPSQFTEKPLFVKAYVAYKLENVDDEIRERYKRKIGGLGDYKREVRQEAERLWNDVKGH